MVIGHGLGWVRVGGGGPAGGEGGEREGEEGKGAWKKGRERKRKKKREESDHRVCYSISNLSNVTNS